MGEVPATLPTLLAGEACGGSSGVHLIEIPSRSGCCARGPRAKRKSVVAQRMAVAAAANPRLQMDVGEAYEPSFTLLLAGVAAPTMIYVVKCRRSRMSNEAFSRGTDNREPDRARCSGYLCESVCKNSKGSTQFLVLMRARPARALY